MLNVFLGVGAGPANDRLTRLALVTYRDEQQSHINWVFDFNVTNRDDMLTAINATRNQYNEPGNIPRLSV